MRSQPSPERRAWGRPDRWLGNRRSLGRCTVPEGETNGSPGASDEHPASLAVPGEMPPTADVAAVFGSSALAAPRSRVRRQHVCQLDMPAPQST